MRDLSYFPNEDNEDNEGNEENVGRGMTAPQHFPNEGYEDNEGNEENVGRGNLNEEIRVFIPISYIWNKWDAVNMQSWIGDAFCIQCKALTVKWCLSNNNICWM